MTLDYDATGLVTRAADPAGNAWQYTYDTNRKITAITDAMGATTRYEYAGDNERLTRVTLPTGAQTRTAYADAQGCPYLPYEVTDAQGKKARYQYDNGTNCNRTQVVRDPGGLNETVTYEYNDPHKQLTKIIDAKGNASTIAYTYDPAGWLRYVDATPPTVTSGTALGATRAEYDSIGRRVTMRDGKGQTTTYTYDALDRVTNIAFASDPAIGYTYDDDGNLRQRSEGAGVTTFDYDDLNRQTSKTLPAGPYTAAGKSAEYAYDGAGNLTGYTDPSGAVVYHYNNRNLLDYLDEPNLNRTTFAYDANGNHITTTYPGGIVSLNLTYDAAQRLTRISGVKTVGGVATNLTGYAYTYTSGGADTALRQTMADLTSGTTTTYTYDGVNRLTQANLVTTGGTTNKGNYQYAYDANGNRTGATVGGMAVSTATDNEADMQTSWTTGQVRTYTYDGNGNETGSNAGEARAYNSRNQTVAITGLNGTLTPIGYADTGQAERTQAGGSAYLNSSLGVARETQGGATRAYTRTPGGTLVAQRNADGTQYYYLFDGQGSVVGMVTTLGEVVARYGYDPYGQLTYKQGPEANPSDMRIADGNPWRYTGGYLDATGLYKLGARYYDPARGRFTQRDPLGGGYIYASDDPINFADPSGLQESCNSEVGNCGGGQSGAGGCAGCDAGVDAGMQVVLPCFW